MPTIERIPKAFISYAREDGATANAVAKDLRARQIEVWIDHEGLAAGTADWEAGVRQAVAESFGVVLVATPASRMSPVVQSELLLAEASGLPVYPVWAAGETWIDSIPLGLCRTQYHDIRGPAYGTGITKLADQLTEQGHALPPHFVYRSFYEILPADVRPPKGTRKCGSRSGNPVYKKRTPDEYMVVEPISWIGSPSSQITYDAILVRPAAYRMAAHLLDDLYLHYLADRFPAFTYGTSWVLSTGPSMLGGVVAIDPRWVQEGRVVVPKGSVSQGMIERPEYYNLAARERFMVSEDVPGRLKVIAATDPWVTRSLVRHPKGTYAALQEVLELTPATQIDFAAYPYVAVVGSHFLPGEDDPALALVQVKECTPELKARFGP